MSAAEHQLTPSVGPGPFYKFSMLGTGELAHTVEPDSPGAVTIDCRVLDANGTPVTAPDILIELCAQDQFARSMADDDGNFRFVVRRPATEPEDGAEAAAPYFQVALWVFPIAEPHLTRMYFPDQDANDTDTLLQRLDPQGRQTLIPRPDGDVLRWDIHLGGEDQTAFLVPTEGPSLIDAGVAYRPLTTSPAQT